MIQRRNSKECLPNLFLLLYSTHIRVSLSAKSWFCNTNDNPVTLIAAQVASAMQTFRPDVVNQLSGAMSLELGRLAAGSANSIEVRQSLMNALLVAVSQVCRALQIF